MTLFMNAPCRWLSDSTDAENEIREIFYQHWEKMRGQMIVTVNEINAWRHRVLEYTNKYADEQINNLANDYNCQRLIFDQTCHENLDTTRAYCVTRSIDLFNELRNACRLLKFQVAQLEYINSTINCVKVITVQEQMEKKKKEQSNASKPENIKPEETLILQQTDNIQDNGSKIETSNETQSHSSTLESSNNNTRSNDNDNDSQAHAKEDDPINKCPVCYMIFPLTMTQNNRTQHVNEHYIDN